MSGQATQHRPKLLVLTPRFPYPVIGGDRLRIYEVCKTLRTTFELTLLSLCESKDEMRSRVPADGVFQRVERVLLPRWRSALNAICAVPSSVPLQVAYYRSNAFREALDRLIPWHDACLAHLIRTGDYVRGQSVPTVLEMTDAISLNYQRAKRERGSMRFKSLVYRFEAKRLMRYERSVLQEFSLVTLVSEVDRRFLLQGQPEAIGTNVLVCTNGVDSAKFRFRPEYREPVIVFIGNMSTLQNLDACHHFIEDVMPEIVARRSVRFRIVGRITDGDARHFRGHANVEVTGPVESVATAVAGASVAVCPIRIGAGVQNKLLEYMALGLPSITSSIGLEGLGARPGHEVLVADRPVEYREYVEKLLDQPAWALRIAHAARQYVERNHEWNVVLAPLTERLRSLVRKSSRASHA